MVRQVGRIKYFNGFDDTAVAKVTKRMFHSSREGHS